MRIIAGQAKGRVLKVPRDVSRPTTDRVRESVFGILAPVLSDVKVLDLFAGSGSLGLESLSRGARECVFVERDRGACRVIEENLRKTGLSGGQVRAMEVSRFLRGRGGRFDLIFADPPYTDGLSDPAAELTGVDDWSEWLADGGYKKRSPKDKLRCVARRASCFVQSASSVACCASYVVHDVL